MSINKAALVEGAIAFIRENAVVVKSKKGNEYLTLPNFSEATVDGQTGLVKFAFMALRPANEARERASQTAEQAIAKLTPEERAALLAKLAE